MQNIDNKKIAIVCDWIKDMGWAETVLEQFLEIFPKADIFTSVFFQKNNVLFNKKTIKTSFIQKIPFLNKHHKLALIFRPLAFESFDLSKYDIVISSSSAESKWVITKPNCLHICYCHTPTRYFWSHYHEYLNMMEFWFFNFFWKIFAPRIIQKLRTWDFIASSRVDFFIANSINTSNRISKYYKRKSSVIYPCIDTKQFIFNEKKQNFYFYIWRCIPYKKFDLIIDSFNKNWKKLILATNTNNKLYKKLKSKSNSNITWKLKITQEEKIQLYGSAKALLFPPEEDFWLVPIEAMACWTPVIAYKKWWAIETVIDWETGLFFEKQTVSSLNEKIKKFEKIKFDYKKIRNYSLKFDKKHFKSKILKFINEKIKKWIY